MSGTAAALPHSTTESASLRSTTPNRLVAGALVLAAIVLASNMSWTAIVETKIASWVSNALLGIPATHLEGTPLLEIGAETKTFFTLHVGVACSVVLLIIPLLATAVAQLLSGRANALRVLPALAFGTLLLLTINAGRIALIISMTHTDLTTGFGWSHTIYGSAIVLAGLALVTVGFIWAVSRKSVFASTRRGHAA